jgi:hypothetical protein
MDLTPLLRWAWGVGAIVFVLGVVFPRSAHAQTTPTGSTTTNSPQCPDISLSLGEMIVPRFYPDGKTPYPFIRAQNLDPNAINYQDCAADILLKFTLLVTSSLACTDTIQVWAGETDCTRSTARMSSDGDAQCWPVTPIDWFKMSQSSTNFIRARDIVSHISNPEVTTDTYTEQSPDLGDLTACESQNAPGTAGLNIVFMAMEADGETVDGSVSYALDGDLVGPFPPTDVTAGIGENAIVVNWTPAVDATIEGFNVYCQPLGAVAPDTGTLVPEPSLVCPDAGTAATTDATVPDAGACFYVNEFDSGSGGSGAEACVTPGNVLKNVWSTSATGVIGEAGLVSTADDGSTEASTVVGAVGISNIPSQYLCGTIAGNTANQLNVQNFLDGGSGIVDGTEYAVTVAAYDGTGNVGIIGNLSCVTPSPIVDFFSAYTKAGGIAGGGFCALEGVGMPVSSSLFGIGMGAALVGFTRRRRRR